MSKERKPASGALERARSATGGARDEHPGPTGRWSAKRKIAAALRLPRGEDLETLSRELRVTAATLFSWRAQSRVGMEAHREVRESQPENEQTQRLTFDEGLDQGTAFQPSRPIRFPLNRLQ